MEGEVVHAVGGDHPRHEEELVAKVCLERRSLHHGSQRMMRDPRLSRSCTEACHSEGQNAAMIGDWVVPNESKRVELVWAAHNQIGHHGIYTICKKLVKHFWWPWMDSDIKWFIWTYHQC